uniref:Uncharacterized protein n=1 Tax=Noctiluca scintillans TaxID=2966 RepID=A0A7S1AUX0_NOCSC
MLLLRSDWAPGKFRITLDERAAENEWWKVHAPSTTRTSANEVHWSEARQLSEKLLSPARTSELELVALNPESHGEHLKSHDLNHAPPPRSELAKRRTHTISLKNKRRSQRN